MHYENLVFHSKGEWFYGFWILLRTSSRWTSHPCCWQNSEKRPITWGCDTFEPCRLADALAITGSGMMLPEIFGEKVIFQHNWACFLMFFGDIFEFSSIMKPSCLGFGLLLVPGFLEQIQELPNEIQRGTPRVFVADQLNGPGANWLKRSSSLAWRCSGQSACSCFWAYLHVYNLRLYVVPSCSIHFVFIRL